MSDEQERKPDDDPDVDSWGFTKGDHAELLRLMTKAVPEDVLDIIRELHEAGTTPKPDDPGIMGWMARAASEASVRTMPAGCFQRLLLDRLRELEAAKH